MTWSLEVVIYHFYDCTTAMPITAICQCPEYTAFLLPPHTSCERVESDFNLTITNGFPGTKHSSMFSCGFYHHFLCQFEKKSQVFCCGAQLMNVPCLLSTIEWKPQNVFKWRFIQSGFYLFTLTLIIYLQETHAHTNIANLMTCGDL